MENEYIDVASVLALIGMVCALISIVVSSSTGLIIAAAFSGAAIISFIIGVCHRDK